MTEDRDFQERMGRIEALLRKLDTSSDPAVRASVKELMQSVMELHEASVNRMMEIVHESGEGSERIIRALGKDPLASNLLILYGLHPEDLATRVTSALEKLGSTFRKLDAVGELVSVEDGVIRLRVTGVLDADAGKKLKAAIVEQIYAFAPDATRLEGLESLGSGDLVGINVLAGRSAPQAIEVGAGKGGD